MTRKAFDSKERGAALLIVLLQVATISVIAVAIMASVTHSMRVSAISSARSQALWYTTGAEDLAAAKLSELVEVTEGKISHVTPGIGVPIVFEMGDGRVSAEFQDASNCFNLNSLSQTREDAELAGAVDAAAFYRQLLIALEIDANLTDELVAAVQDWIDADRLPRPSGAESTYYATLEHPYAAGDTLMVSPNELRAVKGYTKEIFGRVKPYICTRPTTSIGSFNVNTLRPQHAPLLVPVFSSEIDRATMMQELEAVQGEIFSGKEDFLSIQAFALIGETNRLDSLLDVQSTHFRLTGEVVYQDTVTSYEAIFVRGDDNSVSLIRRRFGVDE